MSLQSWKLWSLGAAASAALPLTGLFAEDKPPAEGPKIKIVVNGEEREITLGEVKGEAGKPQTILFEAGAEAGDLATSEYYLGLELGELTEIVKSQLGLKEGLVIESVVPDSPAAKGGLKAHDILTKVGDKVIIEPAELLKAVGEAKDKELALTVVRGGKETTIKVTPTKRPEGAGLREAVRLFERKIPQTDAERAEAEKLIEQALAKLHGDLGKDPVRMFFARPGVLAEKDVLKHVEFPKNLTVRITKEGDQPAKIHVKRDDKEWEVTEDKLSELPEEIRLHVQPMLGKGASPIRMAWSAAVPGAPPIATWAHGTKAVPAVPPAVATRVPAYRVEANGGVEAKLDTILKKLEQMEGKALEQLQKEVQQLRRELDELRAKK